MPDPLDINLTNVAKADETQAALDLKADLVGGKVPSSQLPAYVDDVLVFANLAAFPVTGETDKIYVTVDTNLTYRWSGSAYVEISASLALGETSSTAYRGDRGKTAYDHSQVTTGNPHGTTKSDIGLGNVDNTADTAKPVSTAQQTALDAKAAKTFVENISFQDSSTGIVAQTYTLELYAAYAYTINELKIISESGTCTAAVKIGSTSVTGISAVSVSSSIATGTASAANTVAVGDKITLVITSPSSLNNLQASLKTTRI